MRSVELREARVLTQQQWQNPRCHRIERAQVADRFFSGRTAQASNDVVRGHAGGFVDDKEPVHLVYYSADPVAAKSESQPRLGVGTYDWRTGD